MEKDHDRLSETAGPQSSGGARSGPLLRATCWTTSTAHLHHHDISVFNLDICGSYLRAVDPVLGKLLLHVRQNPRTVMATYSSAGRDRPQLMEGLKSLVTLLWLAPDAIDRLARQLYAQYRSTQLAESDRNRHEVAKNMLLRHMFWLRSHMEHIMIGAHELEMSSVRVSAALPWPSRTQLGSNSWPPARSH